MTGENLPGPDGSHEKFFAPLFYKKAAVPG
jgi:hypothetical protein